MPQMTTTVATINAWTMMKLRVFRMRARGAASGEREERKYIEEEEECEEEDEDEDAWQLGDRIHRD